MRFIAWFTAALYGALAYGPVSELDAEPNNDFDTASPAKLPLTHGAGCIAPAADIDYYSFTLGDETPILINVKGTGGAHFSVDVYDHHRTPIAHGSDMVDLTQVGPGAYFVRIATAPMQRDCYDLQIFAEPRLPPFG